MLSQNETNEMHARILNLVSESGRQSDGEKLVNGVWILNIRQGRTIINILHPLNKSYILIRFRFNLEETDRKLLKNSLNNVTELAEFDHDLRTAITSQNIYYFFRGEKCSNNLDVPIGFDIVSKVFPFGKEFDIDQLDKSIQNVINFGVLGISFLRTKIISSKELFETLKAMSTSPSGMYC